MPTATSTITKSTFTAQVPLKAGLKPPMSSSAAQESSSLNPVAQTSTSATLRSLYTRAARAFVLRDITTTSSLLQSAFALLKPPAGSMDSLADDRRKWDILRITFESTVYTSTPSSNSMPESMRSILSEAPQALATSIYRRSLSLFTPTGQKATSNAAFLPSQVLTTLVYCSLKLDAPDVGRVMIEDWIARREPRYSINGGEGDGYEKVLELYCLHILPKLEQWEYAKEFLQYESELPSQSREDLKASLNSLYTQTMAARRPIQPSPVSLTSVTSISPRSYSPAPSSSSSSSSSLSTTSTHTVVPATSRGQRSSGLSSLNQRASSSSSSTSISSNETATPHSPKTSLSNGHTHNHQVQSVRAHSKSRTHSSASSAFSNLPQSHHHLTHQATSSSRSPPSTYAVIRASLAPYLTNTKVTTFVVLFVLIPLISFVLRMRRRKQLMGIGATAMSVAAAVGSSSGTAASNADLVRRRLLANGGGAESGFLVKTWSGVVRAVGDTVRMAGSGLV